jgi:hypothetical protein
MEAHPAKMEATDLGENPKEIESKLVHQVPKEEAVVKTIRVLEYHHGD